MIPNSDRRKFLQHSAIAIAAASATVGSRVLASGGSSTRTYSLRPQAGETQIVPEDYGKTNVWCFNGSVPGPEIRIQQGDTLKVDLQNNLEEATTIHWHGLRIPHDMDGVPYLTQQPVDPGQQFTYEFVAKDAGTFWYHPHQHSTVQVGRGLYGPLIVEEPNPIQVDRDITWMLDDWRLLRSAQISDDFDQPHDLSHAGRLGNTVTINGAIQETFPVRTGERIRLRLINAANARIFALHFAGHKPTIIAIDGQPVTPHRPQDEKLVLGPAMRIDLIIDCIGDPGQRFTIVDDYYQQSAYALLDIVYSPTPLRQQIIDAAIDLPGNPIPEPNLSTTQKHEIVFEGGAMGGMNGAQLDGKWQDIRTMAHAGKFWAINGVAASGHVLDPMITLPLGATAELTLINRTSWAHPIHLHGHSFRVLARNGQPTPHQPWQDTVLMERDERVTIAFVADNPGDWMFHCHILEHQASGMMGVIRVG